MASGYIHISRKDIVTDLDNGVVYWKNGARYLGEIAKAVLNPGEETEVVKYYLKSAVTKKAILIDAGVMVGAGIDYYFVTDDANFINVRIETADFSSDGGGDGVTVTFLLPESKYYTVHYVEENGDIKLYDVDGDAGTLVPDALPDATDASAGDALVLDADKKPVWSNVDAKIYKHSFKARSGSSGSVLFADIIIYDNDVTPYTLARFRDYLSALGKTSTDNPFFTNTCCVYSSKINFIEGIYISGSSVKFIRRVYTIDASTGNVTPDSEYNSSVANITTDNVDEII